MNNMNVIDYFQLIQQRVVILAISWTVSLSFGCLVLGAPSKSVLLWMLSGMSIASLVFGIVMLIQILVQTADADTDTEEKRKRKF